MASRKLDPVETCKSTAGGMYVIGCIGHVTNILNVGVYVLNAGSVCYKCGELSTNCTDCVYILYNSTTCTHEHLLPKTGYQRAIKRKLLKRKAPPPG